MDKNGKQNKVQKGEVMCGRHGEMGCNGCRSQRERERRWKECHAMQTRWAVHMMPGECVVQRIVRKVLYTSSSRVELDEM